MAITYQIIASNTLGSSAASVTFSSIPNTYTDLVLKGSVRSDEPGTLESLTYFRFNSSSATTYSVSVLRGSGFGVDSIRFSTQTSIRGTNGANGPSSTSNTFTNFELYIPSYTVSQNKPISNFSAMESNEPEAYLVATAGLWRDTAVISSVQIGLGNAGVNFVAGSSFFLYGIKKD